MAIMDSLGSMWESLQQWGKDTFIDPKDKSFKIKPLGMMLGLVAVVATLWGMARDWFGDLIGTGIAALVGFLGFKMLDGWLKKQDDTTPSTEQVAHRGSRGSYRDDPYSGITPSHSPVALSGRGGYSRDDEY